MQSQPIGTIRTRRRKIIRSTPSHRKFRQWREIKVSHHGEKWKRWIPFSKYVWQKETGATIPRGYRIYFRDGNPLNDSIDNLVMVREDRFRTLFQANPEFSKTWKKKQRAAVKRSNERRNGELEGIRDALMNPASFYIILVELNLVFWVPFPTEAAARKKCSGSYLADALRRDGIFRVGDTDVLGGAEIEREMRPDGFLEVFRRYIPDVRPEPKKRKPRERKPRERKSAQLGNAMIEVMLTEQAPSPFF